MKVAVYPGSFDPLHIGHLAILRHLSGLFDCVYLVVSPQNPFKDAAKADNALQRLEAAKAAVARHPELRVKVEDIEFDMPAPHYTIRTLDALSRREPQNQFTLVMGEDNIADLPRWRSPRKLLREYDIIVFPRRDDVAGNPPAHAAGKREESAGLASLRAWCREKHLRCHVTLADAPLVDVSSTQIRRALAAGEDVSSLLA